MQALQMFANKTKNNKFCIIIYYYGIWENISSFLKICEEGRYGKEIIEVKT